MKDDVHGQRGKGAGAVGDIRRPRTPESTHLTPAQQNAIRADIVCSRCAAAVAGHPATAAPDQELGFLRFPQLRALVQLSRATIWRLEKANRFPKRRQLSGSRTVGWSAAEVRTWLQNRPHADVQRGGDGKGK
jgi:prophage regulatory protein